MYKVYSCKLKMSKYYFKKSIVPCTTLDVQFPALFLVYIQGPLFRNQDLQDEWMKSQKYPTVKDPNSASTFPTTTPQDLYG